MTISNKLANIPDSYFGKTMGRKVEHGPLPLINMAVGIPDGETPKGIVDHFAIFEFLKIKNMVHFMVRNPLKKQLLISINDNMVLNCIKMMKCAYFMVLKWFSGFAYMYC